MTFKKKKKKKKTTKQSVQFRTRSIQVRPDMTAMDLSTHSIYPSTLIYFVECQECGALLLWGTEQHRAFHAEA